MSQTWNAPLYDAKHAFVWQYGAALIELLAPQPGERILDVGCGTGHLTAQLAAAGADVVGIDLSAEMIDTARRNYPKLRFEVADVRTLSWDKDFDAILSNAVLHWVIEADRAARAMARALKPGGRLVAELGGKDNVAAVLAALAHGCQQTLGSYTPAQSYFPSIGEYAAVLEAAGLETTLATLFDRPTPLEGVHGLRDWVAMFRRPILESVPLERRAEFFAAIEEHARPALFRDGVWHADYRRLRVVARRPLAA